MRVQHSAWVFDKALNKQTCDELIRIGNEQIIEEATVDGGTKPAKKTRVCQTGWIQDPYIMEQIMEYVATANVQAGWNFDYDAPQMIQFAKYEVGSWACNVFFGYVLQARSLNLQFLKTAFF